MLRLAKPIGEYEYARLCVELLDPTAEAVYDEVLAYIDEAAAEDKGIDLDALENLIVGGGDGFWWRWGFECGEYPILVRGEGIVLYVYLG